MLRAGRRAVDPGVRLAPRPSSRNEAETARILSRAGTHADSAAFPRPSELSGDGDWPEVWGRRIGAVLGPLIIFGLGAWLLFHLAQNSG